MNPPAGERGLGSLLAWRAPAAAYADVRPTEQEVMAKGDRMVEVRWRIVETELWDRKALDLVVPAHITFEGNGMGEMQLIAIGASIDYRVEERGSAPVVELSWLGFDEMDPTSGRGWARVEGDVMHGTLFIHQGDDSSFTAKRERQDRKRPESDKPVQPPAGARRGRNPMRRPGLRSPSERPH